MSNSFTNQVLAQPDLRSNKEGYKAGVHRLPKKLDEEVARLHLERNGDELTRLTREHADYIGVKVEVPYKPALSLLTEFESEVEKCVGLPTG
jgi:adenosylhomocysteinase